MYIPFAIIWVLSVLAVGAMIYKIGCVVIDLYERREYKKKCMEAAEWLSTWGA